MDPIVFFSGGLLLGLIVSAMWRKSSAGWRAAEDWATSVDATALDKVWFRRGWRAAGGLTNPRMVEGCPDDNRMARLAYEEGAKARCFAHLG